MEKDEIIFFDADNAATMKTVTGWVSSKGNFFGANEDLARRDGSTHAKCECGNVMPKFYTKCNKCRDAATCKRILAFPEKPWPDDCPLVYSWSAEIYFSDWASIEDHCDEYECSATDLQLLLCKPVYAKEIDPDMWADDLPEDLYLDDMAPDLALAVDNLNQLIRERKFILSWQPDDVRVEIPAEIKDRSTTASPEGG